MISAGQSSYNQPMGGDIGPRATGIAGGSNINQFNNNTAIGMRGVG